MIKGILSETKIKGVLSGEISWSQYWAARDDGRDGTSFDKGKVLFDFDDSPITNYTYGFPLFVEKGIKVTFYIITNLIEGGGGGSLSWDNVIEMYNAGMDMQSHANQIMTGMTDEEIATMFEDENALFLANGLPLPHYFAYPGGYWNDRVMDATGLYRKTGTAGSPQLYRYTNRKSNKMNLGRTTIGPVNDLVAIKGYMDTAAANKTALLISGHNIEEGALAVSVEDLTELIDYAKSIDVDIITMSELYPLMLYMNIRLSRNCDEDTEIKVVCQSNLNTSTDSISIERSDDNGLTFSEVHVLAPGETEWTDTGLDLHTNYVYRARGFHGANYLPYTREAACSTACSFLLTATGDGSGVARMGVTMMQDMTITLDGLAKFYSDAAGTLDESSTYDFEGGSAYLVYIRLAAGTANMTMFKADFIKFSDWTSAANAPSISGDIGVLAKANQVSILGQNALSGDISGLMRAEIIHLWGSTTISGSVTNLTNLTTLSITGSNTISGDITNLVDLTILGVEGSNTITGSIATLTKLTNLRFKGNNTIYGSINNLTSLVSLYATTGTPLISGDLSVICHQLTALNLSGCAMTEYTLGATWHAVNATVSPAVGYGYSIAALSDILTDMNNSAGMNSKSIDFDGGSNASMADTDQGGIWGDFSGVADPSALAVVYKNFITVKLNSIDLKGITVPGGAGDGTGFPAGFGDWYRS